MRWPSRPTIPEARELQDRLQKNIRICPLGKEPRYVAGVDAAFSDTQVFAAACLFRFPDLVAVEYTTVTRRLSFPYVPGFLSFREGPAIIAALQRLSIPPDVVLVDGQGIAHPRGIGIASFIGVSLDIPAVGCAKSRLIGEYDEPGRKKGGSSPLLSNGNVIGAVLRSRDETRPLFISPGHRIDLASSIEIALACTTRYRIPEPLRCADALSKKIKSDAR